MTRSTDGHETIEVERPGRGLLRLTLSRADRGNAISPTMIREILDVLAAAESDPDVRLISMFGHGKHFCGGADLGAKGAGDGGPRLHDLLLRVDSFPKPVIAFVQGACIGAALGLASSCDVVVAAPDAFFSIPEVRLGMVPGLMPFFIRAVGPRAFRRFGLTGERFDAATARRLGFVGEIEDAAEWGAREAALLDAFLHAGPQTLAIVKRQAAAYAAVAVSADMFAEDRRVESPEAEEGKLSFREKRRPSWWRET